MASCQVTLEFATNEAHVLLLIHANVMTRLLDSIATCPNATILLLIVHQYAVEEAIAQVPIPALVSLVIQVNSVQKLT